MVNALESSAAAATAPGCRPEQPKVPAPEPQLVGSQAGDTGAGTRCGPQNPSTHIHPPVTPDLTDSAK